jgi:hypothetical protein
MDVGVTDAKHTMVPSTQGTLIHAYNPSYLRGEN